MSSTDNIEKLYKIFGVLADAKDKIGEHEKEYLEILEAVKGGEKEKRLASQFIVRFFRHFPHLADQSIEAQIDLCEDDDLAIRKQAIKDLPNLCKDVKDHSKKIADILAQLLMAEDATELATVQQALVTLFRHDCKGGIQGFFSQILTGDEPVRERCLKFLGTNLKKIGPEIFNKESEDVLIAECKKVLQDNTADEFDVMMDVLGGTGLARTAAGRKQLLEVVADQLELTRPYDPMDDEQVDKLAHGLRRALPFFSSQVDSDKFVAYLCDQVLPTLATVSSVDDPSGHQLETLKLLAEFCQHTSTNPVADAEKHATAVMRKLIEYMPLPPETDDGPEPSLEFSYVECLMYALHRLVRHCPQVITGDPNQLKEFRLRLQYFARGIQGYMKKLRESLQGKSAEELKTDESKIKVVALKMTTNINNLIKDLFHSPPSFKTNLTLSWKPPSASTQQLAADRTNNEAKGRAAETEGGGGLKRHTPITFDGDESSGPTANKTGRNSSGDGRPRQLYHPPGGKYSNKVSGYAPAMGPRRGGFRGRPRGGGGGSFRGANRSWRRSSY